MPGIRNGQKLDKRHAIVHTAAIDVKIMRLDKKQVTLSVFRQIDEENIFDEEGNLKGVPWGRVNYTWNKSPEWASFYVVWQKGDSLRKSPMPCLRELESIAGVLWYMGLTWERNSWESDLRRVLNGEQVTPCSEMLERSKERLERFKRDNRYSDGYQPDWLKRHVQGYIDKVAEEEYKYREAVKDCRKENLNRQYIKRLAKKLDPTIRSFEQLDLLFIAV